MNTDELITQLAETPTGRVALPAPITLWLTSITLFIVYAGLVIFILGGLRSDISTFLSQPLIIIEIALMIAILASSLWSTICMIYPDHYGQPLLTSLPYILLGLLIAVLALQTRDVNTTQLMADMPHHVECLSCIAISTILPATGLFLLTQRGASVTPLQSGCHTFITATVIGCIALRLSEATNDMMHLLLSHYLPICLFAAFGTFLGRSILKW